MSRNLPLFSSRVLPLLVVLGLFTWLYLDPGTRVDTGSDQVEAAFTSHRSGQWVEASGRVARLLSDDNEGSRHQRFILELDSGQTLLVAHNIDLARRLPLARDDRLVLRGRYEWNDLGGVVHWTHHDPGGSLQGGWILHQGVRYH